MQLEAQAVGVAALGKGALVACMNDAAHAYGPRGVRLYSLYLPSPIVTLAAVADPTSKLHKVALLGLANGQVRAYADRRLLATFTLPSPPVALAFGRYNREENTLVAVTRAGALHIKMLSRAASTAALEALSAPAGPPPEQDVPLAVPKKTRLYVEQTQREREQAVDMHRTFQRDLCKARLTAARAYVKVLTDGQGAAAMVSSASVSLNAEVQGLGPRFRLALTLKNEGSRPVARVALALSAPPSLYRLSRRQFAVPLLVPSLSYAWEVDLEALQPGAPPGAVRIVASQDGSSLPLLAALVKMPVSELETE